MATESAKHGVSPHMPGLLVVAVEIHDNEGYPESVIQTQDASASVAVALNFGTNNPGMRAANARRLVACWNSFDGVPTDLIECLPKMGTATLPYRILQARGEALALAIEAFLDPQGNPPAATGEWAEAVAALAAYRAARKESEL